MSEPIFTEAGERFYRRLPSHYRRSDELMSYQLKQFISGFTRELQKTDDLIDAISYTPPEDGGIDDKSTLADPATMPAAYLHWRAQLSGQTNIQSLPIAEQRQTLLEVAFGGNKGTQQSIENAVAKYLVGSKYVRVLNRTIDPNSPGAATMWDIFVITKLSETLDNNFSRKWSEGATVSAWTSYINDNGLTQPILAQDTRFYSDNSLSIKSDASGNYLLATANPNTVRGSNYVNRFDVTAGDPFVVFFKAVLLSAATVTSNDVTISYYDASGAFISDETIALNTLVSTAVSQLFATFTPPALSTKATFSFGFDTDQVGAYMHLGEFGMRSGDDTTWIVETVDISKVIELANVKPAGVIVHSSSFEAGWDTVESTFPTWDDWDAATWNEIEESSS